VRDLRVLCDAVVRWKAKVHVKDRSGLTYLTLDWENQYPDGAIVDVSVQSFKDHFSRFSSLIKNGLRFRLARRGLPPVYAHRHARYHDPLDAVVEQWRRQVEMVASYAYQDRLGAEASPADRRTETRKIIHSVAGMTIGEGANGYPASRAEADFGERD
jgi:hypothetical protein